MKKCECCLEGGGENHGCGKGDNKICTKYGTTGSGKGTCNQHGSGTNDDNIVSIFLNMIILLHLFF